jgi:ABC-type Fe3+ transport system substrate-binding protein
MSGTTALDPLAAQWFGIPVKDQPPDHYCLLGLKRFEADRQVIQRQVDERLRLVKMYQRGSHVKLCESLTYKISVARACLLNPKLKTQYDQQLQKDMAAKAAAEPAEEAAPAPLVNAGQKAAADSRPAATSADDFSVLFGDMPGLDADTLAAVDTPAPAAVSETRKPAATPSPLAAADAPLPEPFLADIDLTALDGNLGFGEDASEPAAEKPAATPPSGVSRPKAAAKKPTAAAPRVRAKPPAKSPQAARLPAADPGFELLPPGDPAAADENELGYDLLPAEIPPTDQADQSVDKPIGNVWAGSVFIVGAVAGGVLILGLLLWLTFLKSWTSPPEASALAAAGRYAPRHAASAGENRGAEGAVPHAPPPGPSKPAAPSAGAAPAAEDPKDIVEIGIAYGTEKQTWLEWATQQFHLSDEGRRIRVNLIPMGSIEGARAILDGDKRIHVWSPASRLYRQIFVRDWELQYRGDPILEEETLALTPMVLVMWKKRYEAFTVRAPEVSLRTIYYAMQARTGWGAIAGKPEWGHFKFGHTRPDQSNSGLMTLILMAYDFYHKTSGLGGGDLGSTAFQDYLVQFERGVTGLSHSTADMMREMVLKGPSGFDALIVYESVAIDFLQSAEGRWDDLQVIYPKCNLWNDNPYYILNTPWTTPAHQRAAATFLKFLMSPPIQARALDHGFRPGNPKVPVKAANSPFVLYEKNGLKVEIPEMCEIPSAEVIDILQQVWLHNAVAR